MTIKDLIEVVDENTRLLFNYKNGSAEMDIRANSHFFDDPSISNKKIGGIYVVGEDSLYIGLTGKEE